MKRDPLTRRFPEADERVPALLIVEDEVLIRLSVADYLRDCGFKVFEAADAREALDILATETAVDLVFSDVQLPGGLSGLDVTRSLKEDEVLKAIPVIAVTAFAMKGDDKKIRDAGCDAYMPKPISAMRFLESIKGLLH